MLAALAEVLRKVGKTFMDIDFIQNTKSICLEVTPFGFSKSDNSMLGFFMIIYD